MALPAQALTSNTRLPSAVRVTGETVCTGVFEVVAQTYTGLFAHCDPVNGVDPTGNEFNLIGRLAVALVIGVLAGLFILFVAYDDPGIKNKADRIATYYTGGYSIEIAPDDVNGLTKNKRCKGEEIIRRYRTWIGRQAHIAPPELIASLLLAELRHYNATDAVFDESFGVKEHSIGIAQLEAEDIKSHGYLPPDTTVEQIRDRLRKPKEAIVLLAQEIAYFEKVKSNKDINSVWANANELTREFIVARMTSNKDREEDAFITPFGWDWGVPAYRDIKKNRLLEP